MLDPVLFNVNSGLEERVNIGQWNHHELLNYKLLEEWASNPGPPSTVKNVAKILNLEKYQPVYPSKPHILWEESTDIWRDLGTVGTNLHNLHVNIK